MALADEIDVGRKEIHTDAFAMSVGELISLYEDGDVEVHPEFQRFFRWKISQKSKWIESLLLGLPTPSIFVSQRADGVWDVVDGMQRLSTIYEFVGVLKDESGNKRTPLSLERTKYLPSLQGKKWNDPGDAKNSLTEEQRRFLKRAKLDVKIIQRESPAQGKYDLFERLNTGGSTLSDQELRNCILVSVNRDFFEKLLELSKHPSFLSCTPLPERLAQEQFHTELALRFMIFRTMPMHEIKGIGSNLGEWLNDRATKLAVSPKKLLKEESEAFKSTFDLLERSLDDDSFRKYDGKKKRFTGATLVSAFEIVAMGLGYQYPNGLGKWTASALSRKVKDLWVGSRGPLVTSTGESAPSRIPRTIATGRDYFK